MAQFGKAKGKPVAYDDGNLLYTSATDRTIKVIATFPGVGTITYVGDFHEPRHLDRRPHHRRHGRLQGRDGDGHDRPGLAKAPNIYVVTVPHPLNISTSAGVA